MCDLGAWRVRVVSTKLEYTTSLGKSCRGVLPGHPWNGYLWWVNGIQGGPGCDPVMGGAQGGGAVVAQ